MQSAERILPQDVVGVVHTSLVHHCSCDGCRIITRVLQERPFYVDGKYEGKPWHAEIVEVYSIEAEQSSSKVYRVWIVELHKTRSISTTVRAVVEHWSHIKQKWVYG